MANLREAARALLEVLRPHGGDDDELDRATDALRAALKEADAPQGVAVHPCAKCGVLRTEAEGGTTFTVCDECWDARPGAPQGGGEAVARAVREAALVNYNTPQEYDVACAQRAACEMAALASLAAAEAEAARARGLRVEENIVVEAAILWAERRSDDLPSAVNLLEAVNALLRKRAHLASRPEGEVRDGR